MPRRRAVLPPQVAASLGFPRRWRGEPVRDPCPSHPSASAVWMVMWAEVLAFMLRGKNGFWSPSRQASVPRKRTHTDATRWQGAGRLCPGPAARSRVSSGQCPHPAHRHGAGRDRGEQCLAELSPQGLLTEEEGRRGRRLTHGTGGDARTW